MPTAQDMIDRCAADVGKTGDNFVWLALAKEVPDSGLTRWADWDAPYCVGGLQLQRLRCGMGLTQAALPYYVPSVEAFARKHSRWVRFADLRPGDWIVFDWGRDGIGDHVAVATSRPSGTSIQTIEYNTSAGTTGSQSNGRGCWRRTRYAADIRGGYRPPYTAYSQHGHSVAHWLSSQQAITALGYDCGTADGVNGEQTERAIKAFQKAHGLTQDGIPGDDTWAAIRQAQADAAKPKPEPTPQPQPEEPTVPDYPDQLDGPDRYAVAAAVALQAPADRRAKVYLAAGDGHTLADAVAAAAAGDGVVLYAKAGSDTLPSATTKALAELRPNVVIRTGGLVTPAAAWAARSAAGIVTEEA